MGFPIPTTPSPITAAMPTRTRAIDALLAPDREEVLAQLVEQLSDSDPHQAQRLLESMAGRHPDLAGQLRELFAMISVADAVADESTILLSREAAARVRGQDDPRAWAGGTAAPPRPQAGGFMPGAASLPVVFGDYELLEEIGRISEQRTTLYRRVESQSAASRLSRIPVITEGTQVAAACPAAH